MASRLETVTYEYHSSRDAGVRGRVPKPGGRGAPYFFMAGRARTESVPSLEEPCFLGDQR